MQHHDVSGRVLTEAQKEIMKESVSAAGVHADILA
jgi:hypothetical protein